MNFEKTSMATVCLTIYFSFVLFSIVCFFLTFYQIPWIRCRSAVVIFFEEDRKDCVQHLKSECIFGRPNLFNLREIKAKTQREFDSVQDILAGTRRFFF